MSRKAQEKMTVAMHYYQRWEAEISVSSSTVYICNVKRVNSKESWGSWVGMMD
jgi:hypothetical protein